MRQPQSERYQFKVTSKISDPFGTREYHILFFKDSFVRNMLLNDSGITKLRTNLNDLESPCSLTELIQIY